MPGGQLWGNGLSDIFREVDEDIRSTQLKALWDRYGVVVLGGAVAIVIATAIGVYWQDSQQQKREAAAQQFLEGDKLIQNGKITEAEAHFAALAKAGADGYALLARMKEAAIKVEKGDAPGAIAAFDALASDSAMDPLLRAVASLKAALLLFDTASADELKLRLAPLATPEAPLRYSARELLAFLALRENDIAQARQTFQELADALDAPQGLRARAAEILKSLPPAPPIPEPKAAE